MKDTKVNSHLFTAVLFAGLLLLSAAPINAITKYTDTWVDDYNPDGYVIGIGVTQMSYNTRWSEYHEAQVATTLTSPNGRTVTVIAYGEAGATNGTFSANAEAALGWDWNDIGDYSVTSHHYSECPYADFGSTTDIIRTGISHAVYGGAQCQSDGCLYTITESCDTSCKSATIKVKSPSFCHSYAIRKTGYHQSFIGPTICLNITATTEVSNNAALCWDQELLP